MVKKKRAKPVTAKPDSYFVLVTGVPLKNLKELANSLENMNQWVFDHHVNDGRNDFASWTRDVLKEEELANEIAGMNNNTAMEITILKHLVHKYL